MNCKRILSAFLLIFSLFGSVSSFAQEQNEPTTVAEKKSFNASEVIFGHVGDSHEWHFFTAGDFHATLPLPVIIYNKDNGKVSVFSSSNFGHEGERTPYEGYTLDEHNKVVNADGTETHILDLSVTKNILSMMISVVLLLWLMLSVAKKYKNKGAMEAPTGMQNAMESVIIFMRDEVAKPNLGHKYKRFMPLLLTIFFFIWINNMLGLLPGGANFTGNVAVTGCLAVVFFIVMLFSANKHFWGHLFNPPGVPFGVKCLLVPIEILSMFIKPIALTIRLFANILAGHIVILSVISMIFIFGALSKVAGFGFIPVSLAFSIFMFCLELLVAAIQAFIFANLVAVFIGQAVEDTHEHHDNGQEYNVSENEIIA